MNDNLDRILFGFLFGIGFFIAQWVLGFLTGLIHKI